MPPADVSARGDVTRGGGRAGGGGTRCGNFATQPWFPAGRDKGDAAATKMAARVLWGLGRAAPLLFRAPAPAPARAAGAYQSQYSLDKLYPAQGGGDATEQDGVSGMGGGQEGEGPHPQGAGLRRGGAWEQGRGTWGQEVTLCCLPCCTLPRGGCREVPGQPGPAAPTFRCLLGGQQDVLAPAGAGL